MGTIRFIFEVLLSIGFFTLCGCYTHTRRKLSKLQQDASDVRFMNQHHSERLQRLEKILAFQQGLVFAYEFVDGEFVHTECFGRLAGILTPDDIVGKSLQEILPHTICRILEPQYERAWAGEDPVQCEVKTPSNYYFYYLLSPIRDESGEVVEVVGFVFDITDRKTVEQSLQQSEQRYQRLVEMSPEGIAVIHDTTLTYVNDAALQILGVPDKFLVLGQSVVQWIHEDDLPTLKRRLRQMTKKPHSFEPCEIRVMRGDGQMMELEIVLATVPFEGKSVVQVVFRDVTSRKHTEELLHRAKAQSIVGEIAAGIAHEIRNPLTVLKGFIQLLNQKENPHSHFYRLMLHETEKVNRIVSELLSFAKPHPASRVHADVVPMLKNVAEVFVNQAVLPNITVETDPEAVYPLVMCDKAQLQQAFANILQNAIDAMPHGGDIRIRANRVGTDSVKIEFIDTGAGIDPARIPTLGEPYYATKEKGIGLGLMISYYVIERCGGKVQIDSALGCGTTVTVMLPTGLPLSSHGNQPKEVLAARSGAGLRGTAKGV